MKEILKQQFQASYNRGAFEKNVLRPIFQGKVNEYVILDDKTAFSIPLTDGEKTIAKSITKYGHIVTADERKIELYEVVLKDDKVVERNKVSIGALVKKQIIGNNAIFVNFTYENPDDKNWRFSFIAFDSVFEDGDIKTIETNPKRYTYIFGEPDETYKTAVDCFSKLANELEIKIAKIKDAFGVEAMSKAFFDEYRDTHYKNFVNHLIHSNFKKSAFDGDEKAIRDFVKKLLGRIVFLYFLQKKGWLGATTLEYNDGDKNFISNFFKEAKQGADFYPVWLSKLFFDTLNEKRKEDNFTMPDGSVVKIPYLNGGLFEKDSDKTDFITFEPELFASLFDFFDQYNFTVYEDSPDDHTVAVDPEMLGHIFENLLEDNKDKGAFYTPKQIVQYMTQESLIEYLNTHLSTEKDKISNYIKDNQAKLTTQELKDIDVLLDNVKICDPAIGSGAFPMGLLQEIFSLKERIAFELGFKVWSPATVKENIIQNSIYGVDIEKGAVDIARLRFWLSLIVDEDLPKALPNLDYKIVVGNSLVSKFEDEVIEIDWNIKEGTQNNLFGSSLEEDKQKLLKEISDKQKQFFHTESKDKKKLASEIRITKIKLLSKQIELMIETKGFKEDRGQILNKKQLDAKLETESWKNTLEDLKRLEKNSNLPFNHFDWQLDFPEILNPKVNKNPGFDIVIANPPYLKERDNAHIFKSVNQSILGQLWHQGKMDFWFYFLHKSIDITNEKSTISYITSRYWLNSQGAKKLIKRVSEELSFVNIVDIGKLKVFDNVAGHHMIHIYSKKSNRDFIYKKLQNEITHINLNYNTENLQIEYYSNEDVFTPNHEIIFNKSNLNNFDFELLGNLYDVSQGVVEASDKVSKKQFNESEDSDINVGDGIFVLSEKEVEKLNLNVNEQELLKIYIDPNDVNRYSIDIKNRKYLIYADKDIKGLISNDIKYLNLKKHLTKYSKYITSSNQPYGLHRPRSQKYFENKKIVFKGMFKHPEFTIDDNKYYFGMSFSSIIQITNKYSLEFLLGLINSKYANFWFYNNGKLRGAGVDIGVEKIRTFPIPKIEDHKPFEIIVKYLLAVNNLPNINKHVPNSHIIEIFEDILDAIVFEIYYPNEFKKSNIEIIKFIHRDFSNIENLNSEEQKEVIHETYQKLREKTNEIRNNIKLMKIELRDLLMPILTT
ncbi:MAG: Eco57I restriction-modification methylase domain-containing protein [Flavobacterium sp.]|uniref:Eco57I restriction-modification methylase domain-containing protein n=1 Tax=Flavobacterium sp. TaxID=239 RepID=UPI00391CA495